MNGYGGAMSESDSSIMAPTPSDVMLYTLNKNTNIKNKSEKKEKEEKEEKQKQKEDTERIHGFGINEIQPGEIYYVPIHAAPQCTIHVRPKADDKPDGTPADQEDNVSWSYLSNLYEEGK